MPPLIETVQQAMEVSAATGARNQRHLDELVLMIGRTATLTAESTACAHTLAEVRDFLDNLAQRLHAFGLDLNDYQPAIEASQEAIAALAGAEAVLTRMPEQLNTVSAALAEANERTDALVAAIQQVL